MLDLPQRFVEFVFAEGRIVRLVGLRVNPVDEHVYMEVLPVIVRYHQKLMLAKPEVLDRLPRGVFPLRPARPLAWSPTELVVIDRIGDARIFESHRPHLGRHRFAGEQIVGEQIIAALDDLIGHRVTALGQVSGERSKATLAIAAAAGDWA